MSCAVAAPNHHHSRRCGRPNHGSRLLFKALPVVQWMVMQWWKGQPPAIHYPTAAKGTVGGG